MREDLSGRVLVSGAGAAGLALACGGFDVTVVERAPALRTGGFSTDLRGSAVQVATRMGIVEACRSARVHIREIVQLGLHGQPLWATDGSFGAGSGGDTGDVEILRDDLVSILHAACDQVPSLTWVFGDSVRSPLSRTRTGSRSPSPAVSCGGMASL
jgi:2-polyprenyl-6-methoxyphenol hydroxylase-like FAD-dependent oxidoreductase